MLWQTNGDNMFDLTDDFEIQVLGTSYAHLTIAYLTAPWCGPCRMLKPRLEKLENKYEGLTVVRIDVDTERGGEVARENQVMSVPTLWFYSGGYRVADFTGIQTDKVLTETIERYL